MCIHFNTVSHSSYGVLCVFWFWITLIVGELQTLRSSITFELTFRWVDVIGELGGVPSSPGGSLCLRCTGVQSNSMYFFFYLNDVSTSSTMTRHWHTCKSLDYYPNFTYLFICLAQIFQIGTHVKVWIITLILLIYLFVWHKYFRYFLLSGVLAHHSTHRHSLSHHSYIYASCFSLNIQAISYKIN